MTKNAKIQTAFAMSATEEVQATSAPGSGDRQPIPNVALSNLTGSTAECRPSNKTPYPRPHSKIARLVALLDEGSGASLGDMIQATGWQAHSVRAALTGLRKRGVCITRSVEGSMPLWSVRQCGQ